MRVPIRFASFFVMMFGACAPATVTLPPSAMDGELASVREATARYGNVDLALADGYIPDPTGMCVSAAAVGAPAALGAMGIHYFRPDLLGITVTAPRVDGADTVVEFTHPEVLVYEPQPGGTMKLVAAEYLVFERPWRGVHSSEPPSFHGEPFVLMRDDPATPMDEAHGFEPHYELHLWVHRPNPNGMFQEFNPAVSCRYAQPMTAHTKR